MPVMAGVKLVLEGQRAFSSGMKTATESVVKFDSAVDKSAKNSGGFAGIFDNLRGVVSKTSDGIKKDFGGIIDAFKSLSEGGLGGFNDAIGKNMKMLDSWSKALFAIPPPVLAATLAIAGIVAAIAAFVALGVRGAPLQGIADSFAGLAQQANTTADAMLGNLREASRGTISDIELMSAANTALTGTSGELAKQFGENLPELFRIAAAAAKANGTDVTTAFNDIVKGIKRGSAPILDNVGIIIDTEKAYADYAASINVAVTALDEQQKKIAVLNAAIEAGQANTAAFGDVQETAAEKISRMNATITNIFDKLAIAVQPLFEAILDSVNMFLGGVQAVVDFIAPAIQFILELLASIINGFRFVAEGLYKFFVEPVFNVFGQVLKGLGDFARQMLIAGARLMGELANGIYGGLNTYVMPAVIAVATAIADFLVGQSPPPMGPLSKITEGGANVMKAWTDGFSGATLEPINNVAAFVDTALGDIGSLSLPRVEKRLGLLDKAIAPFENKLAIIKSNFERIAEPANAALRIIDKQIQASMEALNAGAAGSQQLMRQLERQKQFFMKGIDAQQTAVDTATVQLALAKAAQVEERTLLEIRKSQLPAMEKTAKATEKAAKAVSEAASAETKKGSGAGAVEDALSGAAATAAEQVVTPFEQLLGDMGTAFAEPLLNAETGNLAEFNANRGLLDEQLGRLNNANFGNRIGGMFSGIGESLRKTFVQPFQDKVWEVIDFFTDSAQEGTLANTLVNLPTRLSEWLGISFSDGVSLNLSAPFTTAVSDVVFALTSLENPDSLASKIMSIPTSISTWLAELTTNLTNTFVTPFQTAAASVIDYMTNVDNPDGFAGKLKTFFTGAADTEGTLAYLLLQAYNAFLDFATVQVPAAFASFGLSAWNTIAVPLIEVLNWVIDRLNEFITSVDGALQAIQDFLASVGVQSEIGVSPIGKISTAPPDFIAGAADGGFMKGLFKVGERGEELLFSSEKVGVLPNAMTSVFESLMSVFASPMPQVMPQPMYAGAGSSSVANDNSIQATFNGQQDDRYIMQRLAMLRTTKF